MKRSRTLTTTTSFPLCPRRTLCLSVISILALFGVHNVYWNQNLKRPSRGEAGRVVPSATGGSEASDDGTQPDTINFTDETIKAAVSWEKQQQVIVRDCPSQFHQSGLEHSPVLFRAKNNTIPLSSSLTGDLVVCRCPKVGSTILRIILNSFYDNVAFFDDHTKPKDPTNEMQLGSTQMEVDEFERLVSSSTGDSESGVSRIIFVRHPILRILSGYMTAALPGYFEPRNVENATDRFDPQVFATFVTHPNLLHADYKSDCNDYDPDHSFQLSAKLSSEQHWSPPQHCRCGISDCNIDYKVYHMERIPSIQNVLKSYLVPSNATTTDNNPVWLPPDEVATNKRSEDQRPEARMLTADVLEVLNELTRPEQEFFGYLPLTVEQVQNGTVALVSDDDTTTEATEALL